MKKIKTLVALLFLSMALFAQDASVTAMRDQSQKTVKSDLKADGWARKGVLNINGNQGSLNNWAAGGESSTLGINLLLNYLINYKKGKVNWDNSFDIALGIQNATSFGKNFRKSDDRIDITSKLGREVKKNLYATLLGNFNSQALKGFSYGAGNTAQKISNFLAPGKILISAGLDYKPNDHFSIFVSPATSRWVLKSDVDFLPVKAFGVDIGKKSVNELGAFVTAKYNNTITKDKKITYSGRIDLFSNYKRNPQNVDLFMTNLISAKISKNLATTLSLDVIYDDDILKKTQLKEILGVGLTLSL